MTIVQKGFPCRCLGDLHNSERDIFAEIAAMEFGPALARAEASQIERRERLL